MWVNPTCNQITKKTRKGQNLTYPEPKNWPVDLNKLVVRNIPTVFDLKEDEQGVWYLREKV